MPNLTPFIVTGLALGSVYALSGMGMVILFRATGEMNFAMGGVGGIGALIAWSVLDAGYPMVLALAAAVVSATALSAAYGVIVSPRLAHRSTIVKGVATLGLALMLYGVMLWIWSDDRMWSGSFSPPLRSIRRAKRLQALPSIRFCRR